MKCVALITESVSKIVRKLATEKNFTMVNVTSNVIGNPAGLITEIVNKSSGWEEIKKVMEVKSPQPIPGRI